LISGESFLPFLSLSSLQYRLVESLFFSPKLSSNSNPAALPLGGEKDWMLGLFRIGVDVLAACQLWALCP
jgi:hypothetical protein